MTRRIDPPIAPLMERARQLSAQLGDAADSLNAEIEAAEKDLASLRLGVTVSIDLNEGERSDEEQWLTFRKFGSAWRLMYDSGRPLDDLTTTPLVSASREIRKDSLRLLPQLVEALVAAAESELRALQETVEQSATYRASLRAEHEATPKGRVTGRSTAERT